MTVRAKLLILVSALFLVDVYSTYTYSWFTLGRLNHFVKKPSDGILVGGRLTTRQVAEIAEAGFKSFVSTVNFSTSDLSFNGIDGDFPSSVKESEIISGYGLKYSLFPAALTIASVTELSDLLINLPKPVYIHCNTGFTVSILTSLHMYLSGSLAPTNIVSKGLQLGFNFLSNSAAVSLINELTGLSLEYSASPVLELSLTQQEASYRSYYWSHRLGNDSWYNVGQVLESHVVPIRDAGYKTVLSLRVDGEPTVRLSSDPVSGFVPNEEFSDSNGNYDVEKEFEAFKSVGVSFYNLPVNSAVAWSNTDNFFQEFVPVVQKVQADGPTLVHCASGYRSSAYMVAYLALSSGRCSDWALAQTADVGFDFRVSSADAAVVSFMQMVLKC